jgi:hypothetical protein
MLRSTEEVPQTTSTEADVEKLFPIDNPHPQALYFFLYSTCSDLHFSRRQFFLSHNTF